jgi:pyruvate dehydrogenase E2 component (dihydrolipoamide acetyltransferase)
MATPILMPKQGNSVESCLIVAWKKQKGDSVDVGEVLCEVETDKAVMDVESTASGILLETFFSEGADVPVQTVIAVVGNAGESVAEFLPNEMSRGENTSVTTQSLTSPQPIGSLSTLTTLSSRDFVGISPRAKKLAMEKGVAVAELQGTGPSGRILERDIISALASSRVDAEQKQASITQSYEAIPLQAVRKRIAERMLASLQTTAQLTLNAWADARDSRYHQEKR